VHRDLHTEAQSGTDRGCYRPFGSSRGGCRVEGAAIAGFPQNMYLVLLACAILTDPYYAHGPPVNLRREFSFISALSNCSPTLSRFTRAWVLAPHRLNWTIGHSLEQKYASKKCGQESRQCLLESAEEQRCSSPHRPASHSPQRALLPGGSPQIRRSKRGKP
jgi:hypothetical protein